MSVNLDKPHLWKEDIARSVDAYNDWFIRFAPRAFRAERVKAIKGVEEMLARTSHLRVFSIKELYEHPGILFALRMCTAPPIARDRLVGLADVPKAFVECCEKENQLPSRMKKATSDAYLTKIVDIILRLVDPDIFLWLSENREPSEQESYRAATIVADRLCGATADPVIRNAQEQRQLAKIKEWLTARGYHDVSGEIPTNDLKPGMFAFRLNVPGLKEDQTSVNIPVDTVIMPIQAQDRELPLLIEAKSAGDFTNPNKRRKEEATKIGQLRRKYGSEIRYILFLCGYFDSGYLGYEAAEGIDWVWEHRIDDLANFGL